MSNVAVRVENLGKLYRIGTAAERHDSLREALTSAVKAPFRNLRQLRGQTGRPSAGADEFWALRDVSFEIKHGEVLGVIGRNGAGKSTLLKVLSRITEPTTGRVEVQGRVGSLLEVGTGFHPELTGRENVYLNGSILGMDRAYIDRKFDEIVEFSGVQRFIDTPVKRYSSGMYLRLAFAVAAFLEPEVLVVDEVLAVGDAEFQKKCMGRMGEVAKEGRTVLFVSHQLGSLASLCSRALLLVQGEKRSEGPADAVIGEYISMGSESTGERTWFDPQSAPGSETVRLRSVRVRSRNQVTADVSIEDDVFLEVEYWNLRPNARVTTSLHLIDKMGGVVLATANLPSAVLGHDPWAGQAQPAALFRSVCKIPGNFLNDGPYSVHAILLTDVSRTEVFESNAISFVVHDSGVMREEYGGQWIGAVRPRLEWQTECLEPIAVGEERTA